MALSCFPLWNIHSEKMCKVCRNPLVLSLQSLEDRWARNPSDVHDPRQKPDADKKLYGRNLLGCSTLPISSVHFKLVHTLLQNRFRHASSGQDAVLKSSISCTSGLPNPEGGLHIFSPLCSKDFHYTEPFLTIRHATCVDRNPWTETLSLKSCG